MPACAVCGYQAAEAFKFCPECGAAAVTRTSEQRKVVTVLFCDVVGSTTLGESTDPEAVRALLARYFERMKAIVERGPPARPLTGPSAHRPVRELPDPP